MLFDEAQTARLGIALATVYNTLNQFTEAGLLRAIPVDGSRTYFDTNTSKHHHYLIEDSKQLVDIPDHLVEITRLPEAPEGMEIAGIDIVIRLLPSGTGSYLA